MDDLTPFDHQVAAEFLRDAGPSQPIDDAAIFNTIAATESPKWRFGSMFSATKFAAAGAVVALFGGVLLAGVLTQPSDGPAPAAASPSLTSDLLTALVTEEVEPGVHRVVNDGIRDLPGVRLDKGRGGTHPSEIAVGPDGAVWLRTAAADGSATDRKLIRLGDPQSYPIISGSREGLRVGPDGTPWAREGDGVFRRLSGDSWSDPAGTGGFRNSWDFAEDGTVWSGRYGPSAARLDASGWQDHPVDIDALDLGIGSYIGSLVAGANGDVWAGLSLTDEGDEPMVLLRHDGETWSLVDPLGFGSYSNIVLGRIGADGTMWVYLQTGTGNTESDPQHHHLARLADGRWTAFSGEDGVVQVGDRFNYPGLLRVDHNGAVWVRPGRGKGVRVFDGTTWRQYLDGHTVSDVESAPDGRVWVLSDDLYVITPEAAPAAE